MNANNLKDMSQNEIKNYIRQLEEQTGAEPRTDEDLEEMGFFEWEDYVADLEKERGFQTAEQQQA